MTSVINWFATWWLFCYIWLQYRSFSLDIMSSNSEKKTTSQTDGKAGQTKKSDMGLGMMAYKVKSHTHMHIIF